MFVCFFVIEGKCLNSDFNAFGFTLSLSGVLSSNALSSGTWQAFAFEVRITYMIDDVLDSFL